MDKVHQEEILPFLKVRYVQINPHIHIHSECCLFCPTAQYKTQLTLLFIAGPMPPTGQGSAGGPGMMSGPSPAPQLNQQMANMNLGHQQMVSVSLSLCFSNCKSKTIT